MGNSSSEPRSNWNEGVIIFSVDKAHDVYWLMHFYKTMSQKQSMNYTKGNLVPAIGMWKGRLEYSWLIDARDFHLVRDFVREQDAFLRIEVDYSGRQLVYLLDNHSREERRIGELVEVSKEDAFSRDAFTYRPDLDKYWVVE